MNKKISLSCDKNKDSKVTKLFTMLEFKTKNASCYNISLEDID